ncbi:MAG TPA: DNA gyrase modulator, partial [Candidatus Angelobacter sp.]
MTQNQTLFFQKFAITPADLERYLGEALSAGGEYADLYFEYSTTTSINVDESLVKSASQGISAGCGVRVLSGERTGYAHTDDLAPEKIMRAARTAALIAAGPGQQPIQGFKETPAHQLYQVASPSADADIAAKLDLVVRADRAARAYDPRIVQVRAGYVDELREILVVGSDGTYATDIQPLARFSMMCIAKSGENSARG